MPVPEVLLHHPQPNPIRDRTYFVYEIPGAGGDVVIEVFDITGRRVRTLIDEHATPGLHDAAWNVLDDRGNRVKAGVYLDPAQLRRHPGFPPRERGPVARGAHRITMIRRCPGAARRPTPG